jgi:uncharacterized membrane protein YgaE (UPF0421/DUF939 family)
VVRARGVWDDLRADFRDGVRFAHSAVATNGREREVLTQILKAGAAAVLAWAVADRLLQLPLPYVAPLAAMLMVSTTVYRSVLSGVRRVVAVAIGVVLALLVANWAPSKELAMAIVLPVTLLLGQWRRLGDQGLYSAFAALFMITFGQPEGGYVLYRLLETGLGVVMGTAINLLVFPPVHVRSVRDAAQRAAGDASQLLRDIADGLRADWSEEDARIWARRAAGLDDRVSELRETLRLGRESLRFNPRKRVTGKSEPVSRYRPVTERIDRAAESVQTITDALSDAAVDRDSDNALTPQFLARYSALLHSAAATLGTQLSGRATENNPARQDQPTTPMSEQLVDVEQQLARQNSRPATPGQEVGGSLLLAARQLAHDLQG